MTYHVTGAAGTGPHGDVVLNLVPVERPPPAQSDEAFGCNSHRTQWTADIQELGFRRVGMAFDQRLSLPKARLPTTHQSCRRPRPPRAAFHLPPPLPLWLPTRLRMEVKPCYFKQQ
jgi:hypothetical protein